MLKVSLTQTIRRVVAIFFIAFGCLPGLAVNPVSAQTLQSLPALTGHVIDTTNTLDASQKQALEEKLKAFEQSRGAQIVVLMVPGILPEDIGDYTQRAGDAWKIGRKDIGDGLLLVVVKNERKVRIATTKTLEGAIPDLAAKQIIDRALTPSFKQGDFAGGLTMAVDQIMARITGENLPMPDSQAQGRIKKGDAGFQWTDLAVFLFFAVPIGARLLSGIFGRKLGAFATGGAVGVLAWIFTTSVLLAGGAALIALLFALFASLGSLSGLGGSGRGAAGGWTGRSSGGGSSWGGSSSGGFSSGGGGNFGGGGASGNW